MGDLMATLLVSVPSEEVEEAEDEDISLKVKLARLLAEEDSDDDMDDDAADDILQQMSDTPPSKAKVEAFGELLEELES
jgi:hypothetical protein